MNTSIALSQKDIERFWSKVDRNGPNGCWIWKSANNGAGYGKFYVKDSGKVPYIYAHRLSWELANGPIQNGLWVLHKCDNPSCINPEHLFLGTQTDNMQDAAHKGRIKQRAWPLGEGNHNAKLKESDVKEIKIMIQNKVALNVIAKKFGVSTQAIFMIKAGISWAWVK